MNRQTAVQNCSINLDPRICAISIKENPNIQKFTCDIKICDDTDFFFQHRLARESATAQRKTTARRMMERAARAQASRRLRASDLTEKAVPLVARHVGSVRLSTL
jgi:uncharacterized protein YdaU (DUF1376 family)